MIIIKFIIVMICSYFIGNISPSTIIGKSKGIDIKKAGSGNAGTTNALRVLGKKAALITLCIDILKGFLAVFIAVKLLNHDGYALFSALFVFLGHVWPVLYGFKGGKGVATAFGALLAVRWEMALICLAIVILIVIFTRMVSLGSVCAAIIFPVLCFFMRREFILPGIIMALILIFKHRANIERILAGKESKISFSKGKDK